MRCSCPQVWPAAPESSGRGASGGGGCLRGVRCRQRSLQSSKPLTASGAGRKPAALFVFSCLSHRAVGTGRDLHDHRVQPSAVGSLNHGPLRITKITPLELITHLPAGFRKASAQREGGWMRVTSISKFSHDVTQMQITPL